MVYRIYTEKKAAGSAILAACQNMTSPDAIPLGTYRGFAMELYFESFSKEYGVDTIEMQIDSINENDVILIHDDLLATGGTAKAAYDLVQYFHPKKTYMNFIIEITDEGLHGRDLFKDIELTTLMTV